MPNVNDLFPSKYLKAADLEDGELMMTIDRVVVEEIGRGTDRSEKLVIGFLETEKLLILNKTNTMTISRLHGPDTDDWEGKQISLYATEVTFEGQLVEAIRVRSRMPKSPKAPKVPKVVKRDLGLSMSPPDTNSASDPKPDDDIPF